MSFIDYIRSLPRANGATREFVVDAIRDPTFPEVKTWEAMAIYLKGRGAVETVIAAGKLVWEDYCRATGTENDPYGIATALKIGLLHYEAATPQRAEQTRRIIELAQPGDVIVVAEQQHAVLLQRRLSAAGKGDVDVHVMKPEPSDLDLRTLPNRKINRLVWDHEFVRRYYEASIAEVGANLAKIASHYSTAADAPAH